MTVSSRDEIFDKIKEVLENALGVDPEEVTMDATLIGDLGAESIDFLDISFKLEQAESSMAALIMQIICFLIVKCPFG